MKIESLDVLTIYKNNTYTPKRLKWRGNYYDIKSVNLVYPKRIGEQLIWYFDVSDEHNYWKLAFDTENLTWRVEDFCSE